jgi:D-hexose-6-phosphate mutarotase
MLPTTCRTIAAVSDVLPASVRRDAGRNGLPRLVVSSPLGAGEIYLHGAHVTAWQPAGAAPVIWMSRESQFAADKPIRGGVPICFPWFGAHATDTSAPMHGFARLRDWSFAGAGDRGGEVHLTFSLRSDGVSRRSAWPHDFAAEFRVVMGRGLAMALDVTNAGPTPVRFEAALHTYFDVAEIQRVAVTGLEGVEYLDKVRDFARTTEGQAPIRFTGETDRVYLETEATVVIHDEQRKRRIEIAKSGSRSTVVWNPWIGRAKAIADFGDDEWPGMLCIETANVRDAAVELEPGSHHTMTALVTVHPA